MASRLLVPLDGSPTSEAVLPWVRRMAAELGAEVDLLRVVPPSGAAPAARPTADRAGRSVLAAEARRYLRRIRANFRGGSTVRTLVREGVPAAEIIGAARDSGADLVAMSTHGRGPLAGLVVGSVAAAVVRGAGVPVALVRPAAADLAAAPSAAHPGRRPLGL